MCVCHVWNEKELLLYGISNYEIDFVLLSDYKLTSSWTPFNKWMDNGHSLSYSILQRIYIKEYIQFYRENKLKQNIVTESIVQPCPEMMNIATNLNDHQVRSILAQWLTTNNPKTFQIILQLLKHFKSSAVVQQLNGYGLWLLLKMVQFHPLPKTSEITDEKIVSRLMKSSE